MGDQWHYSRAGKQGGPVSGTELKQLASTGQLSPADTVWKEGMGAWVPAGSLKGLFNSNPPPLPVPATPSAGRDARRDTDGDYDERDDYDPAPSRHARADRGPATAAFTANEFGLSSTMLGAITLIGQLYPVIGALAAGAAHGGGMAGATIMLVVFILLSTLAGFLGVMGLIIAMRKRSGGGIYCIVGICVSALAFITSIMMLVALSRAMGSSGMGGPRF